MAAPSKSVPVGRTPYQNQERPEAIHAGDSCSGRDLQGELQCWAFRASTTTRLQHRETVATMHEPARSMRARRPEYDQRCKRCNMFHSARRVVLQCCTQVRMQVIPLVRRRRQEHRTLPQQVWPASALLPTCHHEARDSTIGGTPKTVMRSSALATLTPATIWKVSFMRPFVAF